MEPRRFDTSMQFKRVSANYDTAYGSSFRLFYDVYALSENGSFGFRLAAATGSIEHAVVFQRPALFM